MGGLSICSSCAAPGASDDLLGDYNLAMGCMQHAKAAATIRTYKSNIGAFVRYIRQHVGTMDRLTGGHVIAYLGSMISRKLAPATVRNVLQSILCFLGAWEIQLSFSVDPVSIVDGYDRTSTYEVKKKEPIRRVHIVRFISSCNLAALSIIQLRDILAVLFMRLCFLRVSELAPSTRDPEKGFLFNDIKLLSGTKTISVVIRRRKNTSEKSSYTVPELVFDNIPVFNMTQLYISFLHASSLANRVPLAHVPFFQGIDHDRLNGKPFNLDRRMKFILTHMGIPVSEHGHYGTHSFRIGATTEAVEQGVSLPQIQAAGGWSTTAMAMQYVRQTDIIESHVHGAIGR